MDLKEINELINIRQYMAQVSNSPYIERTTVNLMNGMLILMDRKIISILESDEFKDYINYQDVRKAIEEVAKFNNIKSGLKK